MPNEASVLLQGEISIASGSGSGSCAAPPPDSTTSDPVVDEQNEDGYESENSISSVDVEYSFYDAAIQFEQKSPTKRAFNDEPQLNKAHSDVFKKLVSCRLSYSSIKPQLFVQFHHFDFPKQKSDASSSNRATSRLMKELQEIYRSEAFKKGAYSVELVDDSIYDWNVELRCIDEDSKLFEDLQKLKEKEGKDSIVINITFKDTYPMEPPFVRLVSPVIKCK